MKYMELFENIEDQDRHMEGEVQLENRFLKKRPDSEMEEAAS